LCRLRREVQKHALFTQKAINTEMIDFVYRNSKTFDSIRPRIEAMVAKDWQKLQVFSDIPVEAFRRLWHRGEINTSTPPDTARGMAEKPNQKASKPKQSTRSKRTHSRPHHIRLLTRTSKNFKYSVSRLQQNKLMSEHDGRSPTEAPIHPCVERR
jgi:hypothetical protein